MTARRICIALMLCAGVASADTPRGTYVFETAGKPRPGGHWVRDKKLPPCSAANQQLLPSLLPLSARYGSKGVRVNGEPWVVMLESPEAVVATDPAHSTATRSVQLNIWRGKISAVGVLVVVEYDTSHEPTCISSLELAGTFTPPSALTPP